MAPTDGAITTSVDHPPAGHHQAQRVEDRNYISCPPEDNSIGSRIFWLRPPTHPGGDDGDPVSPPPESVVLDPQAYLDDRTNASTAEGFTKGGHLIKVTFWIAHPPRVSYFTVHFPDLPKPTALAELPQILSTDDDLVLLRIAICHRNLRKYPDCNDYIIYRACIDKLEVLPVHPTRLFPDPEVGLLRCRADDRFFVAALRWASRRGQYKLDLFDSRTWTWSTKSMHVESPQDDTYICTTKVITIGGKHGSIGWVDLWHGILICDVLRNSDDILRYIRFPLLLAPNKMLRSPASCDRDITVGRDGCINYFEMCVHAEPGSETGFTYVSQDWQAATWRWMDSDKTWHKGCTFKASEITVDKSYLELLPDPLLHHCDEATKTKPTLSRLHAGCPAMSLHDDCVVYIMAKVDHLDDKAWMLAVDMRNKALKGVSDFSTERTSGFWFTYLQSDISKHLAEGPPTATNVMLLKRVGMRLHEQANKELLNLLR